MRAANASLASGGVVLARLVASASTNTSTDTVLGGGGGSVVRAGTVDAIATDPPYMLRTALLPGAVSAAASANGAGANAGANAGVSWHVCRHAENFRKNPPLV